MKTVINEKKERLILLESFLAVDHSTDSGKARNRKKKKPHQFVRWRVVPRAYWINSEKP